MPNPPWPGHHVDVHGGPIDPGGKRRPQGGAQLEGLPRSERLDVHLTQVVVVAGDPQAGRGVSGGSASKTITETSAASS
jgi:hypothetical protein